MKRVRYTSHDWSETEFDWTSLHLAERVLYKYATKYGRLGGQIKEKWGQIRFYAHFAGEWLNFSVLVYPGYCWNPFPKWLAWLDYKIGMKLLAPFRTPFFYWQKFWYNYAYQKAAKMFPHIKPEIWFAADHPELIKGFKEYAEKFQRVYKDMYKESEED
jgi:hypothetical protein